MSAKSPFFSVIVPVFNKKPYLQRSIGSILTQTFADFELIIIDDASTDGSQEEIEKFQDPRIRILYRDKPGPAGYAARNLGIAEARADWIAFLDADDEWLENHLHSAREILNENNRADLIAGAFVTDTGKLNKVKSLRFLDRTAALESFEKNDFFWTGSILVKKDLLAKVGAFPAGKCRRGGDSDTWLRLILSANCVAVSSTITAIYNTNFSSVISNKKNIETIHPIRKTVGSLLKEEILPKPIQKTLKKISNKKSFSWALDGKLSGVFRWAVLKDFYYDVFTWRDLRKFTALFLPGKFLKSYLDLKKRLREFLKKKRLEIKGFYLSKGEPQNIVCDVAIVTNMKFPGGNASSTMADAKALSAAGLKTLIIHCPQESDICNPVSNRYSAVKQICIDHQNIKNLTANIVIVRHPTTICSEIFQNFSKVIRTESACFVINNASRLSNGLPAYSPQVLSKRIEEFNCPSKSLFPVGPEIRNELQEMPALGKFLSNENWSPIFSPDEFPFRLKPMEFPIRIGRHTRDAEEKWPESEEMLSLIYPERDDIKVSILGGAEKPIKIFGRKPRNWTVLPFGSIHPAEFLKDLDVFVYFHHSSYTEPFCRNVVEAIFSGVPCILPRSFEASFGSMAIYCEPEKVTSAIQRLQKSKNWRSRFIEYAYKKAITDYSPDILIARLSNLSKDFRNTIEITKYLPELQQDDRREILAYTQWLATGKGAESSYLQ